MHIIMFIVFVALCRKYDLVVSISTNINAMWHYMTSTSRLSKVPQWPWITRCEEHNAIHYCEVCTVNSWLVVFIHSTVKQLAHGPVWKLCLRVTFGFMEVRLFLVQLLDAFRRSHFDFTLMISRFITRNCHCTGCVLIVLL